MSKIKEFIIKNKIWIIFAIILIIVIEIAEDIFKDEIVKCDIWGYNILVTSLRSDIFTTFFKIITMFGGYQILIFLAITSMIFVKDKKMGICIIGNLIGATSLNVLLKNIVQRPRPEGYRLINESGYSFPSGHSMISAAFYGLIIYFIYKNIKNKVLRNILCTILVLLIILIGSSRIYLGVHYASDVIAGFCISIAYLIIFIKALEKFYIKN